MLPWRSRIGLGLHSRGYHDLHVHVLIDLQALLEQSALHPALSALLRRCLDQCLEGENILGLDRNRLLLDSWRLDIDYLSYDLFLAGRCLDLDDEEVPDELKCTQLFLYVCLLGSVDWRLKLVALIQLFIHDLIEGIFLSRHIVLCSLRKFLKIL